MPSALGKGCDVFLQIVEGGFLAGTSSTKMNGKGTTYKFAAIG